MNVNVHLSLSPPLLLALPLSLRDVMWTSIVLLLCTTLLAAAASRADVGSAVERQQVGACSHARRHGRGAVCLDGSPGGYQIRRGAPGNTRWVVFHQGGGWCNNDENCAERANTALGSSNHPN